MGICPCLRLGDPRGTITDDSATVLRKEGAVLPDGGGPIDIPRYASERPRQRGGAQAPSCVSIDRSYFLVTHRETGAVIFLVVIATPE